MLEHWMLSKMDGIWVSIWETELNARMFAYIWNLDVGRTSLKKFIFNVVFVPIYRSFANGPQTFPGPSYSSEGVSPLIIIQEQAQNALTGKSPR
jgi:hypothetical protein